LVEVPPILRLIMIEKPCSRLLILTMTSPLGFALNPMVGQ
jgi:hypothetical protein